MHGRRQYLPQIRQGSARLGAVHRRIPLQRPVLVLGTSIAWYLRTTSRGEIMVVNKLDGALFLQQQALTLRANRQQILAGNIANADTPHYQAKDFDFAAALHAALAGGSAGNLALRRRSTSCARLIPTGKNLRQSAQDRGHAQGG